MQVVCVKVFPSVYCGGLVSQLHLLCHVGPPCVWDCMLAQADLLLQIVILQLTADGQQLLSTIEDVWLPVLQAQSVPVGFVFRTSGGK